MSNRDPDDRYEALPQALPFFGDQLLKRVHTCIPGVVKEYDFTTRRARVQPAVDLLLTDGTTLEKPIILDVPVIFPAGGGYTVHFPLMPDDPVMLFFSERDIANFKEKLEVGPPLSADIMAIQHAVCIPGFVLEDTVLAHPATAGPGEALIAQSNDGQAWIHLLRGAAPGLPGMIDASPNDKRTLVHIEDERIYATVDDGPTRIAVIPTMIDATVDDGTTTFHMEPGMVAIVGDVSVTGNIAVTGTVDGVDVSAHTHGGVMPGGGSTSPPN